MLFNKKLSQPVVECDNNLGNGLGIRQNRNGTVVYMLKYVFNGRQFMKTICPTSLLSIDDARLLAVRVKLAASIVLAGGQHQ